MAAAAKSLSLQDLPPHLLHRILCRGSLSALDLVHLEATCHVFRAPLGLPFLRFKSVVEIVAMDLCKAHPTFSALPDHHRVQLLHRCSQNWKILLRYLQLFDQANGLAWTPKGKVQIAAGKYHSLILACDKGIFAWGSGLCMPPSFKNFGLFLSLTLPQNMMVTQVSSSHVHVAFITSNGELYTYGDNKAGCCGFGETNQLGLNQEEASKIVYGPTLVEAFKQTQCKQVAAGVNFTVVLTVEGHVYASGNNEHGQLGLDDTIERKCFTKVDMLDGLVVQISAGSSHALAVTLDGAAFSWGDGGSWRLGHYDVTNELRPRMIQKLKDDDVFVTCVSAGYEHSVALDSNGQVHTWGRGYCGALGHDRESDVRAPKRVEALVDVRAIQVCSRKQRTFVLSDDGRLYGFGSLELSSEKIRKPSLFDSLKDHQVSQVSAGLYHTLVVTDKGKLLGFGDNSKGQLGKQRLEFYPEPVEIVDLDRLASSSHSSEALTRMPWYSICTFRGLGWHGSWSNR